MIKKRLGAFTATFLTFLLVLSVVCIFTQSKVSGQTLSGNMISNGGFESGTFPWHTITSDYAIYDGTIDRVTDVHSGYYSGVFKVTNYPGTDGYIALSQAFQAQVGETYTLSFYYKNNISYVIPHIFCKDSNDNDIVFFTGPQLATTTAWTQATMSFGPIPPGTISTQIHFDPAATGVLQLDDVSAVNNNPNPPSLAVIQVPSVQYPTIQSALYGAINGTQINVASGVYNENFYYVGGSNYAYLNQVTLKGSTNTVIKGNITFGTMKYFTMSNVIINGNLKIGFGSGGDIQFSTFKNLTVAGEIDFVNAQSVTLSYSTVHNVILTGYSTDFGSGDSGIVIQNNDIQGRVQLGTSMNDQIIGNTITGASVGIDDGATHVNWHSGARGNLIMKNTISSCAIGINLASATMYAGVDNITQNTLKDNIIGVKITFESAPIIIQNTLSLNNFINNQIQASCVNSGSDIWSAGQPMRGNYWSDYKGTDANNDGVGDIPYIINSGNVDNYPLMSPWVVVQPMPNPTNNPAPSGNPSPSPTTSNTSPTLGTSVIPETSTLFAILLIVASTLAVLSEWSRKKRQTNN